jgi:signal transduction histidine kinase
MSERVKKPRPERDQTDESLRTERVNSDKVLEQRRSAIEEAADLTLERARDQADAVLDTARDRADAELDRAEPGAATPEAVTRERAREDEALQDERDAADASLEREREEHARMLAALLPLEREKTDRYLLTERLRSDDAVAHRDDFLGMVSHDLRNLLSGIVLNATLVLKKSSESEEGRRTAESMQRIQRYVARMNRLIGDLIDVVSIDAGKLAIQPALLDAGELLGEAIDAFAQVAADKGITLEAEFPAGPLPARFDHGRMLQVLANLITNALKFTARGGHVVLRGERDGSAVRLSVRDTGTGIPVKMLEAVFDRFWQVGQNDQRGLGLGLYISRCIVEAHDGKIWAESTLDEGSVFHLTIPISTDPAPVAPQS